MKRIAVSLALSALIVGGVAGSVQADTPGCASSGERQAVDIGMRMVNVHDLFDTTGNFIDQSNDGEYRYQYRQYVTCETDIWFIYGYRKPLNGDIWKLWKKAAI
jgi:hypothetical protein